jgi:hypothetical protein
MSPRVSNKQASEMASRGHPDSPWTWAVMDLIEARAALAEIAATAPDDRLETGHACGWCRHWTSTLAGPLHHAVDCPVAIAWLVLRGVQP